MTNIALLEDDDLLRWMQKGDEAAFKEIWNGSPSNPASNINGGAMGYFSAHTIRTRSIMAP